MSSRSSGATGRGPARSRAAAPALGALLLATASGCTILKIGNEPAPDVPIVCEAPATLDVYVDVATEREDGTGSEECPLPTITEALRLVDASRLAGVTIHVAEGTYDESAGEEFPLLVPPATVLDGAGRDETIVVGEGLYEPAGWLGVQASVAVVMGGAVPATVRSLALRPTAELPDDHEAIGVYCASGDTRDGAPPTTEVDDVLFDRSFHRAVVATDETVAPDDGCHLRLLGSEIRGAHQGVLVDAPEAGAFARAVIGAPGEGNVVQEIKARPARDEGGVVVGDGALTVHVIDTAFVDAPSGVVLDLRDPEPVPGRVFAVEASRFLRVGRGVAVLSTATLDRLVGNRFEAGIPYDNDTSFLGDAPGVGLLLSSDDAQPPTLPRVLHARENVFVGNRLGVVLTGRISLDGAADFGRADDPGKNVFRCNSGKGQNGGDAWLFGAVTVSLDPITLPFVGNAWDHAPPEAKPNGATNGLDVLNTTQVVLDTADATIAVEGCPEGKVP